LSKIYLDDTCVYHILVYCLHIFLQMIIANKYKIIEKLGEGSFGLIFKGENIRTFEKVAIKMELLQLTSPEFPRSPAPSATARSKSIISGVERAEAVGAGCKCSEKRLEHGCERSEQKCSETNLLKNEAKIYQYLQGCNHNGREGFPTVKWFGIIDNYYYMVLPLLGDSLCNKTFPFTPLKIYNGTTKVGASRSVSGGERLEHGCERSEQKCSVPKDIQGQPLPINELNCTPLSEACPVSNLHRCKTLFSISIDIIKRIQYIHENGLIHRDIKPDNFLFGPNNEPVIHMIDFGFCRKYLKADNKTHIELKTNRPMIGTPNFVSVNVHNGLEPSRRDDLESAAYMMIYFQLGQLDWMNPVVDLDKMREMKINIHQNKNIHPSILIFLDYCRKLKFDETPDYNIIIGFFQGV